MLTGGPNSYQNEEELRNNVLYLAFPKGTSPAKYYIDDNRSFSSNENCIIYSAPLVGVIAFFT